MTETPIQPCLDRPYEPLIAELGLKGRIHWVLLRRVSIPIFRLFHSRGLGMASRALSRVLGDETVTVRVLGRVYINVRLNDPYWLWWVLNQRLYEREFFPLLDHLRQYRCGFVDGGANIGWWSVMADRFFGWPCVAIEAGHDLLALMEANRRANAASFSILHRILWRTDGEKLPFRFDPIRHSDGQVALEIAGRSSGNEEVGTVSLDTVVFDHLEAAGFHPDLIVVKLDLEGAEGVAIEGAVRALGSRDMLLLYEDHGRDLACSATAAMLAFGLQVYLFENNGDLRLISDIPSARAAKPLLNHGYNFLAVNHRRLAADAVGNFIARRSRIAG